MLAFQSEYLYTHRIASFYIVATPSHPQRSEPAAQISIPPGETPLAGCSFFYHTFLNILSNRRAFLTPTMKPYAPNLHNILPYL